MNLLAEIADKMPSVAAVLSTEILATAACASIAFVHRAAAWWLLAITLLVGGGLALAGADEAFVAGPMHVAIGGELGWPYVIATTAGPLLPCAAVVVVLMLHSQKRQQRGFPVMP
jgi:hypothetical protein